MKDFERTLYEAILVAFGKILGKYNAFAQGIILKDVGREIVDYLDGHGFQFEETGDLDDLATLIELFVKNGFAEKLEIEPADKGQNYIWHDLYGVAAYKELYDIADNPFLSCPLNLCLYYLADKHNKTLRLHRKTFDLQNNITESQYEIVDKETPQGEDFDPLVIENVRLYELAQERADKLEKAQQEIKILRGIIPICTSCKRIRNDEGYWQQVETYISEHSEALFSHGLCPDCIEKLYPEYSQKMQEANSPQK
ncbi:MAG: hypothetical protein JXM69_10250 [Anaerolineae bacterium]|nr:hypothetical protein [Anaerolineae bacterium]